MQEQFKQHFVQQIYATVYATAVFAEFLCSSFVQQFM